MATPAETAYEDAAGCEGHLQQLVMEHLSLVKRIVNRLAVTVGGAISEDDLISAGTVGLVEAAHRFDPSRGTAFVAFAAPRVKGAVVDCLRQNDWLGKSARNQLTALRQIVRDFRSRTGRRPTIPELAAEADMRQSEVLRYLSYQKCDYVSSLDDCMNDSGDEGTVLGSLIAADCETPPEAAERRESVELVARAIEQLGEREQQIIVMYYYEDLYMAEMAEVLNVSESRVSQLHTRAIYNLTRKLEEG
jgi:RNA polymerase sigma factor for flagellar operon FliA